MPRIFLSLGLCLITFLCIGQPGHSVTDPEKNFKEARLLFMKGDYALAYPLLKPLIRQYPENTQTSHAYLNQDIQYYYLVCGLKLNQEVAEEAAKTFIESANNEPRQQMMSFHLARYYFIKTDFARAAIYYERAGYENLSNEEIADAKFELAYSYFNTGQYDQAKPLFNEIHQLPDNKYYFDANYYYGYLSFRDNNYPSALKALLVVQDVPKYHSMAPYYIVQLYYFQNKKEEALKYAEKSLAQRNVENRRELNLLTGQIYFEQKEFAKALPLLEAYVAQSDKVSKEVMYELSYCYYVANQVEKSIEGFKQLSNEQDSLGQNSMYLLGDLYLRTNQKVNARNAFKYSADNNSNRSQQEISRFNYAKLSYELGYNDVALSEMNNFLDLYPASVYANEGKEIIINLLANTNNYSEALELYKTFDNPTPTVKRIYPKIIFGKATELINEQKLNEANDLFTQVINDPNSGNLAGISRFWKGEISYRQNRYEEAVRFLNEYLKNGGVQGEANISNAHYILGYSYLGSDLYQQAIEHFRQVAPSVNAQSNNLQQDAYVRTADAYFMLKNYQVARNMYQQIIDHAFSQSDYAFYQQAMIAGINNAAEKIRTLNSLVQRYPQSDLVPEAYIQIANAYMAQQKFGDAIPILDKVLTISAAAPQFPKVYLKRALSNYNLSRNNEALSDYQKLINQYPQSEEADEALENMKNIYIEMGRPNDYVDFVKKSGKVISASEADSLTFAAAELKYLSNDCAGSITGFNNYLSGFPQGAYVLEALFYRTDCYAKNKDWANAVKGYEDVINMGTSRFIERAALALSRIYYFDLKDYAKAKITFIRLREVATSPENQLEALRGLTRSYYQTKDFAEANNSAQELLTKTGISTDDKAIANLVLGKSLQIKNQCGPAIEAFKQVAAINKSAWGAEARYEIAHCQYMQENLDEAEKSALNVIKVAGVDFWIAKSYILLGDIYWKQKDYFNAKATFKSVSDNATIPELKTEAAEKLKKVTEEEQLESKIKP